MSTEEINLLRRERDEARGERDMLLTRLGVGASSDAMMRAALAGLGSVHPFMRPLDGGDYGRCEATRAVAPPHLHEAMDEMLATYRTEIDQYEAEKVRRVEAEKERKRAQRAARRAGQKQER